MKLGNTNKAKFVFLKKGVGVLPTPCNDKKGLKLWNLITANSEDELERF
nr:MAG TPA: hypothetical protein [Caudoviricetes sp.]